VNLVKMLTTKLAPALTAAAIILYWSAVTVIEKNPPPNLSLPPSVVMAAPLQVLLTAGDRFLAGNVSAIRAAASATIVEAEIFRLRSHEAASQLHPCHEDNYWIGNASLSWGGAETQGMELLKNATRCRYWDEWPPFFYGFNSHFFHNNVAEAQRGMDIAAERSANNVAVFKTFSIMLTAGEIKDTDLALEMLKKERDKATDKKLRESLNKRVSRLNGLIILREAHVQYEKRFKTSLIDPHELIKSGILEDFPIDPLQIGYDFRDNEFHLLERKIR
jgi:hypothetical protein